MKKAGFMMLETLIAMSALALLGLFSIQIMTTYTTRVRKLKTEYEVLAEVKKHIDQQLLFPLQKSSPLQQAPNATIPVKTQFIEIQPRSSLKPFAHVLKIFCASGRRESEDEVTNLVSFIIAPPKKEAAATP